MLKECRLKEGTLKKGMMKGMMKSDGEGRDVFELYIEGKWVVEWGVKEL